MRFFTKTDNPSLDIGGANLISSPPLGGQLPKLPRSHAYEIITITTNMLITVWMKEWKFI